MVAKTITPDQAIALARNHAGQGRVEKARELYQQVLKVLPKDKRAQQGLKALQGKSDQASLSPADRQSLLDLYQGNQLPAALEACNKLLQAYPRQLFLHNFQGAVYAGLRQAGNAIKSYRSALALDPQNGEIFSNLGSLYQELGQLKNALSCFEQALKLNPDSAHVHNNLGNILMDLDREPEAENHYRKALALQPRMVQAHDNLGLMLYKTGNKEAARACFEKALSLDPNFVDAHYNLSRIKHYGEKDGQAAQMEALYLADPPAGDARIKLCFALAKVCEDSNDQARSFRFLEEGNTLRKEQLHYRIESHLTLFGRLLAYFRDNDLPTVDKHEAVPLVFIIGMPRSGTSLVEQILASHSRVHGGGELETMRELCAPLSSRLGGKQDQGGDLFTAEDIQALRQGYLEALQLRNFPAQVISDKMPGNFLWLGFILAAFPEAKVVHVTRDPMAVCWSNYKHYFVSNGHGYTHDFKDLAAFYRGYLDLMALWRQRFPGRLFELNYELLTENQEQESRRLLEYCGLSWEPACLDFHLTSRQVKTVSSAQVRQPMYQGSSQAWKRFEDYLQPLRQALRENAVIS